MSRPEEKIASILSQAHIKFEREKTFSELKRGLFRFDFYIPSLNIIIEYDGEQHMKQIKRFHKTRQEFLHAQESDRRKNSYCLAKNIKLYRIPYFKLNQINSFQDIIKDEFLVKDKWHNDVIRRKLFES